MISKHMRIKLRTAKFLHLGLILAIAFVSALAHGQLLWVATWTTSPTRVPDSESFNQWNEAHPKIAWKGATIVRGTLRYWLSFTKASLAIEAKRAEKKAAACGAVSSGCSHYVFSSYE